MSAQRRTATKRGATSTATPAAPKRAATQEGKAKMSPGKVAAPAADDGKGKKKAAAAKPHPVKSLIASLERWYRETRAEMSKITWPDQDTTRNLTIVVIGVSIALGLFLGGIDFILVKILEAI
jgi:preprotein translocase subunit SecE